MTPVDGPAGGPSHGTPRGAAFPRAKVLLGLYGSFWAATLLVYLVGVIGHWPAWAETFLVAVGCPWSLVTFDAALRLEGAWGFGWATFLSQIALFVLLPAVLDFALILGPLVWLWRRRPAPGGPR